MKKIIIGSKNPGKVAAVEKAICEYGVLSPAILSSCEVDSGVRDLPVGLDEIITGAKNRAKGAYETGKYDLAFGLETGLFEVPETKSGYMSTTCCVIFDGKNYHLGFSSCFEYPPAMIKRVLMHGEEINEVAFDMGFANDRNIGKGKGMIGFLSKQKITRSDLTYDAIRMAMVHLENPEHYST